MRPDQTRRLLVFVVCALGVGALYLVPGVVTSPEGAPAPSRMPSPESPNPTLPSPAGLPTSAAQLQLQPVSVVVDVAASRTPQRAVRSVSRPAPVTRIWVEQVDATTVTVRWAAAEDDAGVVGYSVWLNGFDVASTAALEATVDWFNDDTSQHVVQVRAVDSAGHESVASTSVLISRPTAAPPSSSPHSRPTASDAPGATE